jgi:hypothetical protein
MVTAALSKGFKGLMGKSEAVVPGNEVEAGGEGAANGGAAPAAAEEEEDVNFKARGERQTITQAPTSSAETETIKKKAAGLGGVLGGFGDEEGGEGEDAAGEQCRGEKTDSKKQMVDTGLTSFIMNHVYDDAPIDNYTPSFRRSVQLDGE